MPPSSRWPGWRRGRGSRRAGPRAPPGADQELELALLYLPALAAGALAWSDRRAARLVEPALAAGALLVIGYGLSGRLLPGVVHLHATARAGGRLEQPMTYWNATGALAAIGLVLCARLAGDVTRPRALRIAAAAAAAPLGMGAYLSFSRGAIACLLAGLAALVAFDRSRAQLRAAAIALGAGALAGAAAAPFGAVRALHPGHATARGPGGPRACSRSSPPVRRSCRPAATSAPPRCACAPRPSSRWSSRSRCSRTPPWSSPSAEAPRATPPSGRPTRGCRTSAPIA